jgi:hypothetical protein
MKLLLLLHWCLLLQAWAVPVLATVQCLMSAVGMNLPILHFTV